MKQVILISIFLSFPVFSKTKKIIPKNKIEDIGSLLKIKNKVDGIDGELSSLKSKMSTYEEELNSKNTDLINTINRRKEIENLLDSFSTKKREVAKELKQIKQFKQKILTKMVVEEFGENKGAEQVIATRIMLKEIKSQIKKLMERKENLVRISESLKKFQDEYRERYKNEMALSAVLKNLEEEKQKVAQAFIEKRKEKEGLQSRYDRLKTQFVVGKNPTQNENGYALPVEKYTKMDYKTKGITFHFREKGPVLAPKGGKVSYSGRLSTYGNVVIVDHGDEVRSVLLGKFVPKVKKGMSVKKNELIGYTKIKENETGKVYFEVRQKDKVQNTIFLVEKKFLSKDKSNKI